MLFGRFHTTQPEHSVLAKPAMTENVKMYKYLAQKDTRGGRKKNLISFTFEKSLKNLVKKIYI